MTSVSVSNLSEFEFCPRVVYLRCVLGLKSENTIERLQSFIEHAVRKELSMRQPKIMKKIRDVGELHDALIGEVDAIIDEIPLIYGRELGEFDYSECLNSIKSGIMAEIGLAERKLVSMFEDVGLDETLRLLTPWKIDFTVRSEKLGLCGRMDKVMRLDFLVPVGVKSCKPPDGVWDGDRLRSCAYGMLLEDRFGCSVPYGIVEYTRIHEERHVFLTEDLRRRVFYLRDCILDVLGGAVPEICPHGNGRKCESCGFSGRCYEI